ncbi:hypothetical protein TNCV_4552801 [Trichonephila clavipes]|nr:hypothetical protein TNCV_4552801 [Trichonephila clavipes]
MTPREVLSDLCGLTVNGESRKDLLGKLRPILWHSSVGYISAKTTSSWRASTYHGVQQGKQCAGQLTRVRHGACLEYTQNIVLQHQGEDPTEKLNLKKFILQHNSVVWTGKVEKEKWDDKKKGQKCRRITIVPRKNINATLIEVNISETRVAASKPKFKTGPIKLPPDIRSKTRHRNRGALDSIAVAPFEKAEVTANSLKKQFEPNTNVENPRFSAHIQRKRSKDSLNPLPVWIWKNISL